MSYHSNDWRASIIEKCLDLAWDYEREAKRLRALAEKIRTPPEGVRVEPGVYPYDVRFVGPTVDHTKGMGSR